MPSSSPGSLSSQYSTDVSSIASSEMAMSSDELASSAPSEIAYDESQSDTASEAENLADDMSRVYIEANDKTDKEISRDNDAAEDKDAATVNALPEVEKEETE